MSEFYNMIAEHLSNHNCESCGDRLWLAYCDGHVWDHCINCPPKFNLDPAGYVTDYDASYEPLPNCFETFEFDHPHKPHERYYRFNMIHIRSTIIRRINLTEFVKRDPIFGRMFRVTLTGPQIVSDVEIARNVAQISYNELIKIDQKLFLDSLNDNYFVIDDLFFNPIDALARAIIVARDVPPEERWPRWYQLNGLWQKEGNQKICWKMEGF